MEATQAVRSCLHVGRFRARYFVAADHPAPESVRAKLDDAVGKNLAAALAERLAALRASGVMPGVFFIRRLAVSLEVNAAWDRERIARVWAEQIARALAAPLSGRGDAHEVIHFDDRAAYVACFLSDLAAGRAWSRWFYTPFDGLRMLPISAALRAALCDDPSIGLAALLRLTVKELSCVVRALSVQDARRIVESLAHDATSGTEAGCFQALSEVWESAELGPMQAAEQWRNTLRLFVCVLRGSAVSARLSLVGEARAMLRLAGMFAQRSALKMQKLLTILSRRDMRRLYMEFGPADAEVLLPLMRCPLDILAALAQSAHARYASGTAEDTQRAATSEPRYTPFGGMFLLLPLVDDLALEEATRGWPAAAETPPAALVRLLLLAKCSGRARAAHFYLDPLARDLTCVPPALSLPELARWARKVSVDDLDSFLEASARWCSASGEAAYRSLALVSVKLPGGALGLLLDVESGCWLYAQRLRARTPAHLLERAPDPLRQLIAGADFVVCDETCAKALRAALPSANALRIGGEEWHDLAARDGAVAEFGVRVAKLAEDCAHLSLPQSFRLPAPFNLALSVAAQGLMRAYARRLPGFATSGLAYLFGNFLDFAGSLEDEETRRVVRVGRPPLNLVLMLTGMNRSSYRLNWLDERPFVLFQEG